MTLTLFPWTMVRRESKVQDAGWLTMSEDTIGSSVYSSRPVSWPSAAFWKAVFTSSLVTSRSSSTTRSVTEPVGTGTRIAMPSSLPASSGITSAVALAAPVVVGMMFSAAARARRRSLCGKSRMRWSFVYAWTVVIMPLTMPKFSSSTFAIGATQFVVQEALEMMWWLAASYLSLLTPITMVMSSSLAGAEMMTFLAPPVMCWPAVSPVVKMPVDSITMSTPRSPHGMSDGLRSDSTLMVWPSTVMVSAVCVTSALRRPRMVSYFIRCALVAV